MQNDTDKEMEVVDIVEAMGQAGYTVGEAWKSLAFGVITLCACAPSLDEAIEELDEFYESIKEGLTDMGKYIKWNGKEKTNAK